MTDTNQTLREALQRIQYKAKSLADAQVIALEALALPTTEEQYKPMSDDEITLMLADKIGFGDDALQTVNRSDLVSVVRTVEAIASTPTTQAQALPDERAAFEAWASKQSWFMQFMNKRRGDVDPERSDYYVDLDMVASWNAWRARAAMAQALPDELALPPLPDAFALSISVHDGEHCKWPLLECQLLQKHPNEKQKLYTADQMRDYARASLTTGPQPATTGAGLAAKPFSEFDNDVEILKTRLAAAEEIAATYAADRDILRDQLAAKPMPDDVELAAALLVCRESHRVSISEVQRKLRISWNRAQDLCVSLHKNGLVTGLDISPPVMDVIDAAIAAQGGQV